VGRLVAAAARRDSARMSRISMTPEYDVGVVGGDGGGTSFDASEFWWLWLVVGIAWIAVALVVLQFDQASVKTIGLIVGLMFLSAGVQQLALALVADSLRWLWIAFGLLYLVCGVICLVHPEETFHGFADILGFLFLVVGLWWTIRAFLTRELDPLWWVGLTGGILLMVMAFWTSGQFFLQRAYTLLVFAGIWALMQGITDIMRAFQVRAIHRSV
jgi:uncharacterized membrane protein HdeD (DUF308 family)